MVIILTGLPLGTSVFGLWFGIVSCSFTSLVIHSLVTLLSAAWLRCVWTLDSCPYHLPDLCEIVDAACCELVANLFRFGAYTHKTFQVLTGEVSLQL